MQFGKPCSKWSMADSYLVTPKTNLIDKNNRIVFGCFPGHVRSKVIGKNCMLYIYNLVEKSAFLHVILYFYVLLTGGSVFWTTESFTGRMETLCCCIICWHISRVCHGKIVTDIFPDIGHNFINRWSIGTTWFQSQFVILITEKNYILYSWGRNVD